MLAHHYPAARGASMGWFWHLHIDSKRRQMPQRCCAAKGPRTLVYACTAGHRFHLLVRAPPRCAQRTCTQCHLDCDCAPGGGAGHCARGLARAAALRPNPFYHTTVRMMIQGAYPIRDLPNSCYPARSRTASAPTRHIVNQQMGIAQRQRQTSGEYDSHAA